MAKCLIAAQSSSVPIASANNLTRYSSLLGGDNKGSETTLPGSQLKIRAAGVLSNFAFRVTVNSRSTNTTVRTNINGSAGALNIVIPGGATGWFEDTSNTDSISAGDMLAIATTTLGGGGGIQLSSRVIAFESSGAPLQPLAYYIGAASLTNSAYFAGLTGYERTVTNSINVRLKAPDAGTWSGLSIFLSTNSFSTSVMTVASEINGSVGNQSITIPAGSSGFFEDAVNTDTIAAGDELAVRFSTTSGGTGNAAVESIQSSWSPTNGRFFLGAVVAGNQSISASADTYIGLAGRMIKGSVEADSSIRVPFESELSNLRVHWLNAAASVPVTFRTRINGSNGAQVATAPIGTSGWFEDNVNTDSLAGGELVTIVASAATGDANQQLNSASFAIYQQQDILLEPDPQNETLEGFQPRVGVILAPGSQDEELEGFDPDIALRVLLAPEPQLEELEGLLPEILMTRIESSQAAVMALADVEPAARVSQAAALTLAQIIPPVRVSQSTALALAEVIPPLRVSSSAILILADAEPCTSRAAQLWTITRRDGEVLRFTSLDVDFRDGAHTYRACHSLQPSASESSTALGQAGDIELTGIIDSDAISEADLLAGLYDDAYVEVWLVPWQGRESRRRLAAGWCGNMSRGDTSFKMDVVGPGSRLEQQAVLEIVTPSCRYNLGDSRCGFDIEAVKLEACEVLGSVNRGRFYAVFPVASIGSGSSDPTWENGYALWTGGANAGQRTEVKSVDFGSGEIVLWALAGFRPGAGDTFDLYPGCRKDIEACIGYGRVLDFGGEPDVPGQDAILETPDAKY